MSGARAVQISIDEELLSRIDKDPEARIQGRSAFVRSAVQLYLRVKASAAIDEALHLAYHGRADEALAEVEPLIQSQEWPHE